MCSKNVRVINQSISGSLTVEACLLMPFLLLVIFMVITFSFYLHDRCIVSFCMNDTLQEVATLNNHSNEYGIQKVILGFPLDLVEAEEIEKRVQEETKHRLLLCTLEKVKVKLKFTDVTMTVKLRLGIGEKLLTAILGEGANSIHTTAHLYDPVTAVRYERLIVDEFKKTRASEKLKELLEKAAEYLS